MRTIRVTEWNRMRESVDAGATGFSDEHLRNLVEGTLLSRRNWLSLNEMDIGSPVKRDAVFRMTPRADNDVLTGDSRYPVIYYDWKVMPE